MAGTMTGPAPDTERVRTRFAPSPTGRLHLGNLRIAAFNWLFARRHGGSFVLRVEDTDPERNVAGAEALIMEDLRWLGLEWDEGPDVGGPHAPYRQGERGAVYRRAVEALLTRARAYPCWCTEAELEESRERVSGGDVLRYDGRCRRLSAAERAVKEASGKAPAVRFAVPEGIQSVEVEDAIRGVVTFPSADLSDFVIQRADGTATYNFAVVADDVEMEITHVIRGAGHLSNTPRQALLFDALDRSRPVFAHLPTVLAPDGGKLSKRTGSAGADRLRDEGYHPEGVLNYLSLLGWSSPDGREVLGREELVAQVSLERLGRSDTVYDPEKLRWLSAQHLARIDAEEFVEMVQPYVDRERFPFDDASLRLAIETVRTRLRTCAEVNEHLGSFYPGEAVLEGARVVLRGDREALRVLGAGRSRLGELEPWTPDGLRAGMQEVGREVGVRGPSLFRPIRMAVTGESSGPDLANILAALGRREVLERLGIVGASGTSNDGTNV